MWNLKKKSQTHSNREYDGGYNRLGGGGNGRY